MPATLERRGTRNGVDVDRLIGTIGAIKDAPSLATFRFRARNRWMDGAHNRSVVQDFYGAGQEDATRKAPFVFDNDEPDVLLGQDRGANPVEYVLHALAGCLTTTLVYHAAARGIEIRGVESTLEGDLDVRGLLAIDDGVRPGFREIRVTFRIDSDAPEETLRELVQFAKNHSPVSDTVRNPVRVEVGLAS